MQLPQPRYEGEVSHRRRLRRRLLVPALAVLLMAPAAPALDAPQAEEPRADEGSTWGAVPHGPYGVGFRSRVIHDRSRSYLPERYTGEDPGAAVSPRPVQVSLWYPTAPGGPQPPVTVGLYRRLADVERAPGQWTAEEGKQAEDAWIRRAEAQGLSAGEARERLHHPSWAMLDAPIAEGRFPLVVYGPMMLSGVGGNTALYELLASHGYIVAAHPSFGVSPGMMDTGTLGLETQVRDMELALSHAREQLSASIGDLGVMGHSWGGLAAVVLALRHPELRAVLSLDGSEEQWSDLVLGAPEYDLTKLRWPFLQIQTKDSSDQGFYDSIRYAPKVRVTFPTLGHFDVLSPAPGGQAGEDGDPKKALYELNNRFVLAFFDAFLKAAPASLDRLVERYSGDRGQETQVRVEHSPGSPPPPSEAELVAWIRDGKITRAEKAIRAAKTEDPRAYGERQLIHVGELVFWAWSHFPEALQIFSLAAELHPRSARTHEMLGSVYFELGELESSLASYRRSLELDGGNLRVRAWAESVGAKVEKLRQEQAAKDGER